MESLKHWYRGGDPNKKIPTLVVGGFGAFAGACSVYGNTPLDVVKTRLQVCDFDWHLRKRSRPEVIKGSLHAQLF